MPWSAGTFTRNNGQHTGPALWAATEMAGRKIQDRRSRYP